MHVGVNNGWSELLTQDQYVSFQVPDKQNICKATGSMEISKYIAHPLVALTFRLEYVAQMPVMPGSIPQPFSIGWELFLPSMN